MKINKEKIVALLDKVNSKKTAVAASAVAAAPMVLSVAASASSESGSGNAFVAPSIADTVTACLTLK